MPRRTKHKRIDPTAIFWVKVAKCPNIKAVTFESNELRDKYAHLAKTTKLSPISVFAEEGDKIKLAKE